MCNQKDKGSIRRIDTYEFKLMCNQKDKSIIKRIDTGVVKTMSSKENRYRCGHNIVH